MAGLKTFWILFALFIFSSCVPQTKQTDCGANEAFNSTLRTCVPIIGGPSSFITIDNFSPSYTVARYKNDTSQLLFSITVANPYNQAYTTEWQRLFNGAPTPECGNALTCTLLPSYLGNVLGEIGIHILTAKILDANGSVVDTHNFEIKIDALPKPTIMTSTLTPGSYSFDVYPTDSPVQFSFKIKNNGATINLADNYRTTWTVQKNGSTIYTETDLFGDITSSGEHFTYLGTAVSPYFDPDTAPRGVGNYVIKALVQNDYPGEVVGEYQWSFRVKHPDVKKISNRDIYAASTNPGPGTISTAYNGIPYSAATAYNFIPQGGFTNQGNYCVTVTDGDGTYAGDSLFVRVDYYLNGSTLIYSNMTTASDHQVCLSDASVGTLSSVLFANTSSTAPQSHTLVARVTDVATSQEYTASDMIGSLGGYPITWNFLVMPANAAPTVAFTANSNLSNITCSSSSATARNCSVAQDAIFRLGINATDDFYSTSSTSDAVQSKFTYTMTLLRNGMPISTCSKTTGDVSDSGSPGSDFVGPDYLCNFTVPSYDANGPVNPQINTYAVSIVFCDVDSPIPGSSGMCGTTMTYNLSVSESNTAPAIVAQLNTGGVLNTNSTITNSTSPTTVLDPGDALDFISEGQTIQFNLRVQDAERDNHQIQIFKCNDFTSTCATSSLMTSGFALKTNNILETATTLSYIIPENFLTASTVSDVLSYFKITVTDCPSLLTNPASALICQISTTSGVTATPRLSDTDTFSVRVRNYNPAPQFGGTPNPLTTASLTTMVGYPLTIDPGTVTDASTVSSENNISFQWYIDSNGGDNSYAAITGATSRILRWTPSNGISAGTTINLALCVSDGTAMNPQPTTVHTTSYNPTTGSNCLRKWDVTVRPNVVATDYNGGAGSIESDVAVWQDTTNSGLDKKVIYSAYADASGVVFIEKTVFDSNGVIYNDDSTGFRTVSFTAIHPDEGTVVASSVKDISLAGTDEFLYIAYQAAESSTPSSPRIRVRRIDKRYGGIYGSKSLTQYPHAGKFGFRYDDQSNASFLLPTTDSTGIRILQSNLGESIIVEFLAILNSGEHLTTNSVPMYASDTPASNELCSAGACTQIGNSERYRTFINDSSDRDLQGLSAYTDLATPQVFLYGSLSGAEYLDLNSTVSNYITGKLGKIMILGGSWYLPFVDLTTGATINHIRVLSAGASATDTLNSSLTVDDSIVYSAIGAVNNFTNDFISSSQEIVVGAVSTSNVASIAKYNTAGVLQYSSSPSLFSGGPIDPDSLRFSAPVSGNNNYFVAARVLKTVPSTYEWMIGRCDSSLVCSSANFNYVSNGAFNTSTSDILEDSALKDLSIESYPSSSEARLMVTSEDTNGDTNLYTVRMRTDGLVSCGHCNPVNLLTNSSAQVLSSTKHVATAKIDTNMAIGTAGSSALSPNENQKDVLFTFFPLKSGAGNFLPHIGIINAEVEVISSTSTDTTGTLGHRPAFFSDN